ncbi:glycoside hydrolase family 3 N-terminal domain-containing protein [Arthrobacter sp. M4]|uniref:glycoside hydrolase family 3 N-terminal domain-containing protein n=1 Tax=Arthrobacter sp. M4 TaxID=218160 RepID=UPI0027DFD58B|nr:glycoside hydrolase family 3 N-terminal domain-containing protein [Arthrobacter sp. M4]
MASLPGRPNGVNANASILLIFLVTALSIAVVLAACTAAPDDEDSPSSKPDRPSGSPASPVPYSGGGQSSAAPSTASVPPGEEPLGWGPRSKDLAAARAAVAHMSPAQKAGQVLMGYYKGTDTTAQAKAIRELHLGGSIVMRDNVPRSGDGTVDTSALARATAELGKAAREDGRSWPALVGVDQEGGVVARLGAPLTEWPTPLSYGAAGSADLAAQGGKAMGAELAGLGFTVDFAPSADVTIGPNDPTVGSRSFSGDPEAAAMLSTSFGRGMLDGGVLPASKHFPGHGSVTVDSHDEMPVQDATAAQLRSRDWKPFLAAVQAGQPMVMMGHIAMQSLEPGVPASVSSASYKALRNLGFQGVVVTDALNMGAITSKYPGESAAPKALAAGADLLLMPEDVRAAHRAILAALDDGSLSVQRLDEATVRVVTMMLWHARTHSVSPGSPSAAPQPSSTVQQPRSTAPPGSAAPVSRGVSAAAITVVDGPCTGRLVPESVTVTGGTTADRERFAAAARRVGVAVGSGPVVALAGFGSGPVNGDVAVSLDAPWPLARSTARSKVALYGRTPGAYDALLAVLTGAATAPGRLPAVVGPYPAGTGCKR